MQPRAELCMGVQPERMLLAIDNLHMTYIITHELLHLSVHCPAVVACPGPVL